MKNIPTIRRATKQRSLIYDEVIKRRDHPSADEIYFAVHEKDKSISKATVYRNLKILSENGDINQVKVVGADRFDSTLKDHYHIVCNACGRVFDAPIEYKKKYDEITEKQTGFKIFKHLTLFEGICPECLEQNK